MKLAERQERLGQTQDDKSRTEQSQKGKGQPRGDLTILVGQCEATMPHGSRKILAIESFAFDAELEFCKWFTYNCRASQPYFTAGEQHASERSEPLD